MDLCRLVCISRSEGPSPAPSPQATSSSTPPHAKAPNESRRIREIQKSLAASQRSPTNRYYRITSPPFPLPRRQTTCSLMCIDAADVLVSE